MKILVIGATKGIGLELTKQALARGHDVRAFARSADKMTLQEPRLETRAGDARDPDALASACAGMDAVALTLGVDHNLAFVLRPVTLFSEATTALLPAMEAAGLKRLVALTGFGAGDSRARVSMLEAVPFTAILGRAYADKSRQEEIIRASGLDWTIVRPGILTGRPGTGRYRVLVSPESWHNGIIPRADVAHFMLGELETPRHVGEAPVLVR